MKKTQEELLEESLKERALFANETVRRALWVAWLEGWAAHAEGIAVPPKDLAAKVRGELINARARE